MELIGWNIENKHQCGIYLLVHTISHSVYQSHIANKKTLPSCRSFFFFDSGVRKRPIARSILAVSESVLKFRTVNFLANHNFQKIRTARTEII